ncbi:glutamine synthetase III [Ilumatobacter nonamiensis]|nr:glutamine synthetase III [Ilumatobacter nonamiensis]
MDAFGLSAMEECLPKNAFEAMRKTVQTGVLSPVGTEASVAS